jgi:hypothetical protein
MLVAVGGIMGLRTRERVMREWNYWTRNKLQILSGYLPTFNTASKRSRERLYIDLMAGDPVNRDRRTTSGGCKRSE